MFYNQALSDVRSSGAGVKSLYCRHSRLVWADLGINELNKPIRIKGSGHCAFPCVFGWNVVMVKIM